MHKLDLTLPSDHDAKLLYLMDYPKARDELLSIAWLQQGKQGNNNKKNTYQRDLPKIVERFVEDLVGRPEFPPDVVLVPASGSRLFDPYLNRLREVRPDLVVVDNLFAKSEGYKAGVESQKFEVVLAAITLTADPPSSVSGAGRILILDDIYNTGNTAGAMITRIQPFMAVLPKVIVACALYVPFEPKTDWEAVMKEMGDTPAEGTGGSTLSS
jgi:hypoxanthine phosphoribosyltransferase